MGRLENNLRIEADGFIGHIHVAEAFPKPLAVPKLPN
jgi:hypothetical protein